MITFTLPMIIPEMPTFSHDALCIISVREMPVRKMLENAIATDETVKKRIALQINWIPEYLPSMIICAPYHMFWSLFY